MTVRYAAPGRINLIGEHTDYNLGFSLPIALPQRTVATFAPAHDDAITVVSDRADAPVRIPLGTAPGEVTGWAAYVAGVMWALRRGGHPVPGGAMSITSDVEMGSPVCASTPKSGRGSPSGPKTSMSVRQRVCSTSSPRCSAGPRRRC